MMSKSVWYQFTISPSSLKNTNLEVNFYTTVNACEDQWLIYKWTNATTLYRQIKCFTVSFYLK